MIIMLSIIAGFIVGIILTATIAWNIMPKMMLHENLSPYGVEETVNKIKENAEKKGWIIASIKPLHQSIKKHGGGDIKPVMLINICEASHAYNILEQDENKKMSVFMPCTISVYQKSDGKTYIGNMNASLLGNMFGGRVAEVMAKVSVDQQEFIKFAK